MKKIIEPDDYDDVLKSYKGSHAQIWLYNVSLGRLLIRLYWPYSMEKGRDIREDVYILGASCEFICGRFSWHDADISIEFEEAKDPYDNKYKIVDTSAGFELIASGGIAMYTVPDNEIGTSFINF